MQRYSALLWPKRIRPFVRRIAHAPGDRSAYPENTPVRWVIFCPDYIARSKPEADAWISSNKPAGVPTDECLIIPASDAPALNRRLAQTRAAIGKAALPRPQATQLMSHLLRDSEVVPQWRGPGWDDRHARERAADEAFLDDVAQVAEAAETLARHVEAKTSLAEHLGAMLILEMPSKAGVSMRPTGDRVRIAPVLAWFFRSYGRLAEEIAASPRLGQPHRYRLGPFLFSEPLESRTRLPSWEVAVVFGAVYAARVATGSAAMQWEGEPMPEAGSPLYPVAAAFLADMKGERLAPDAAQKAANALSAFLRRNPDVGWCGWEARTISAEK